MANPTIVEVAKLAGVSIATVSRCLNDPGKVQKKTLARVRQAIETLQFRPNMLAQNFRRGRTNLVLVVVHEIGSPLFQPILDGIRAELAGRFSLVLTESRPGIADDRTCLDMLVAKQVEGVILLCSFPPFSAPIADAPNARPLPIVIGLEPLSDDLRKFPTVSIDNHLAAREGTQYLIGLGHRRIVFLSGPKESYATKDRAFGYAAVMAEMGLPKMVLYSDLTAEAGSAMAAAILPRSDRPTAIFCANDELALGVLAAAAQLRIEVPRQLSVLGFDDMRYAAIANPPLSTVAQPAWEIGVRTARRLLRAMDSPQDESVEPEILPHRLIIRQSTAALPAP